MEEDASGSSSPRASYGSAVGPRAVVPGVFLYFASRTQVMPKLRAFIDHMQIRIAALTSGPCASLSLAG